MAESYWIVRGPILLAVSIFGILCNVLTVIISQRLSRANNYPIYFTLIPILDSMTLLFVICNNISLEFWPWFKTTYEFNFYYAYFGDAAFLFFIVVVTMLVASLSIQRAEAVLRPMAKLKRSPKHDLNIALSVSFILSVVTSLPVFFQSHVVAIGDGKYKLKLRDGYTSNHVFAIRCMIGTALPCIVIFICNMLVCGKQNRRNENKNINMGSLCKQELRKQHQSVNRILTVVTFSTLFFKGLRCTLGCMEFTTSSSVMATADYKLIRIIAVVIDSSICLLLFCLPSKRFRTELKALFTLQKLRFISSRASVRSTDTTQVQINKFEFSAV